MMGFETENTVVSIASENGDANVPAKKAVKIAKKEAKDTEANVTIRDHITDAVLATVKPDGTVKEGRRSKAQAAANLKAGRAALAKEKKEQKMATKTKATTKKTVAKKTAKPATKRDTDKPSGMTAALVKLALRASGVTPAQLNDHSNWKGAPWKWFFSNPKKTGVADRFGYKLKVERDGRAVTYFLTAK